MPPILTLPLKVAAAATTLLTVISGVPVNPPAVPVVFKFEGSLAAPIVPEEILLALIPVIPAPPPERLALCILPLRLIVPAPVIP